MLLICLFLAFSLFSCAKDDSIDDNPPTDNDDHTPEGEVAQTDEKYPGVIFYDKGDGTCLARICPTQIITEINIPEVRNGLTVNELAYLGPNEFIGFVTDVTIPDTVTRIGDNTFVDFHQLKNITIPGGVTEVGARAFYKCEALKNITFDNNVTEIGEYAFYGCNLTSVVIKSGIIGNHSFENCTKLESIDLGDGVTKIGSLAFRNCDAIEEIDIPDSITSIGVGAFEECSSLKTVNIGCGITKLFDVFGNCTSLTHVNIPNSVTSIEGTFRGCTALSNITLPDSITLIYDAFSGCHGLKSITVPDSVESIDGYAFTSCQNLTDIVLPTSVTYIGDRAFYGCASLTNVYYLGEAEDFSKITFGSADTETRLTDAIYYYRQEKPTEAGSFWYYDNDGKAAIWQ